MLESLFLVAVLLSIVVLVTALILYFLIYRTALHQIEVSLGVERTLMTSITEMNARVGTSEVILMRLETALAVTGQKLDLVSILSLGQKLDRLEGLMQATKTDQAALTSLLVTLIQTGQQSSQMGQSRQSRKGTDRNASDRATSYVNSAGVRVGTEPIQPPGIVPPGQVHPVFQGPVIESTKPIGGGELPPRT